MQVQGLSLEVHALYQGSVLMQMQDMLRDTMIHSAPHSPAMI